jgi:hypothetical protein
MVVFTSAAGLFPYHSFDVIAAPTRLQIAVIQASNPQQMLLQGWHHVLGPCSHCLLAYTVRPTQLRVIRSSWYRWMMLRHAIAPAAADGLLDFG